MHLFEVRISAGPAGRWPVVADWNAPRFHLAGAKGSLELDLDSLTGTEPHEYGVRLGEALFRGAVGDAFLKALGQSTEALGQSTEALGQSTGGLHVSLGVEADELNGLHWERL